MLSAKDRRTPGLFKVEFEGDEITALTSKMYYVTGGSPEIYCGDFMSSIGEIEEVEIDWSKDNNDIQQQMWKIHGRGGCDKASCKGVQKAKNKDIINIESYNKCLENSEIIQGK